jgi:hypothetical protein
MSTKQRFGFALCGVLLATSFCAWIGYELNWKHQRQQAKEWLAAQTDSWYAPSLEGARIQASAPSGLRLFGEQGIVAIGLDAEDFKKGHVPYSRETLERLFPESRVDFSRDGRFVVQ